jgi:CubicO group peptidase (beta-lactamase class C family)
VTAVGSAAVVHDLAAAHEITSLRVVHGGEVVIGVGPQDKPFPVSSIRKSILSALFGWPIERGLVDLDSTLADLGIDDSPELTPLELSATLEHLLASSSGVYLPLNFESSYNIFQNTTASWPERGSANPGAKFHYSNWDFNVLGEIYQRVTGTALFLAVDRLLAQPLGFQDWNPLQHSRLRYACDPLGATPRFPNYAMQLSARDLASFGQLYLNCGTCNRQQIVPASWVEQSTRCLVQTGLPKPFGHYGYLWWTIDDADESALPGGSYSAIGLGGKAISIVPADDLVIVALCEHMARPSTQVAIPDDIVNAVRAYIAADV